MGLDFVHFNGMSGEFYFPEMMGGGGAMLDYDNDGDLDLYLVQGRMLGPGIALEDALFPPRHPLPLSDRLYRNDLSIGPDGKRLLGFTDVTAASGELARDYGMGVATGDFDGDGWTDLYVTNFGPNRLLRNNGDGTFSDVTGAAGAGDNRWSVAATFFDYDRDGFLDLYVGNYLDFTLATHKVCLDAAGAQDWCGPAAYRGARDRLLHNRGNGTFEDVSRMSGVGRPESKGLGAVAADLDRDGLVDLYVANDGEPNFLWLNQGDGTFRDEALYGGCAVGSDGLPQASMGVAVGDYDNDGDDDIFMTHLTGENNALFRNDGGLFTDVSAAAGLSKPSWPLTGFGTAWFDFDNDSWLDLLTLNGAVRSIETLVQAGDPYPLHQKKMLFRNAAGGSFEEATERAGGSFELSEVGRGAAFGDVDNDGDTDVLVVNNSGPARLLLNRRGNSGSWVGLRCTSGRAASANRGTRFAVLRPGQGPLWRRVTTDGSYASASDPRVLVGLGEPVDQIDVMVRWPNGEAAKWRGLAAGSLYNFPEPNMRLEDTRP